MLIHRRHNLYLTALYFYIKYQFTMLIINLSTQNYLHLIPLSFSLVNIYNKSIKISRQHCNDNNPKIGKDTNQRYCNIPPFFSITPKNVIIISTFVVLITSLLGDIFQKNYKQKTISTTPLLKILQVVGNSFSHANQYWVSI